MLSRDCCELGMFPRNRPLTPTLSPGGREGEEQAGSWLQCAITGSSQLPMNRNAKRTVSPLTPALSPLRGEGEHLAGSWLQCTIIGSGKLPMNPMQDERNGLLSPSLS